MILIWWDTPSKFVPVPDEIWNDLKSRKPAKESVAAANVLSAVDGSAALETPPETERLAIMGTAIDDRIR